MGRRIRQTDENAFIATGPGVPHLPISRAIGQIWRRSDGMSSFRYTQDVTQQTGRRHILGDAAGRQDPDGRQDGIALTQGRSAATCNKARPLKFDLPKI